MTTIYACPGCEWRVVLNPVSSGPNELPRIDCTECWERMAVVD